MIINDGVIFPKHYQAQTFSNFERPYILNWAPATTISWAILIAMSDQLLCSIVRELYNRSIPRILIKIASYTETWQDFFNELQTIKVPKEDKVSHGSIIKFKVLAIISRHRWRRFWWRSVIIPKKEPNLLISQVYQHFMHALCAISECNDR